VAPAGRAARRGLALTVARLAAATPPDSATCMKWWRCLQLIEIIRFIRSKAFN
jgi:hypothetical protein